MTQTKIKTKMIDATGTADSSTFLSGDGTWSVVSTLDTTSYGIQSGLNYIAQLTQFDRQVSNGYNDGFGEAYASTTGKKLSVDIASTDCRYQASTDSYFPAFDNSLTGTTDVDGQALTDVELAFDGDWDTAGTFSGTGIGELFCYVGKVFGSPKYLNTAKYKFSLVTTYGRQVKLQTYNGSIWSDVFSESVGWGSGGGGGTFNYETVIDDTVSGVRVMMGVQSHSSISQAWGINLYELQTGGPGVGEIIHTIPPGILGTSNKLSVIGVPFVHNYEPTASIEFKIYNSTTDSGWLDINETSTLSTTFHQEPTKLSVKLAPASTAPEDWYPSIKGFYVKTF